MCVYVCIEPYICRIYMYGHIFMYRALVEKEVHIYRGIFI